MIYRGRYGKAAFAVTSLTALIISLGVTSYLASRAYAVAPGAGDGGCCGLLPPELEERAESLENSFRRLDRDTLSRQQWARELCNNHPCGDEVTEEQARELLRDFVARARREEDIAHAEKRASRGRTIAWASVVIAGLSTLLSVFGLWQTHQANQVARIASDRSIRNEAHIDSWREKNMRSSQG